MTGKQMVARQNRRVARLEKLSLMREKLVNRIAKIEIEMRDLQYLIDRE